MQMVVGFGPFIRFSFFFFFNTQSFLGGCLGGLLCCVLVNERLMDVGDHTSSSDGSLDQSIQLFVTTDGELRDQRERWRKKHFSNEDHHANENESKSRQEEREAVQR